MTQRTSIFATPIPAPKTAPPSPLDVSDFGPKAQPEGRPRPEEIDAASQGGRFRSREPDLPQSVDLPSTRRRPMVYRTGRNVTFSAKTTKETVDQFYAIAARNGWKAGETFEKAVAALLRENSSERPVRLSGTEKRRKAGCYANPD